LNDEHGILLFQANDNTIDYNTVTDNDESGISLQIMSKNNIIANNTSMNNDDDGIHLYSSGSNTIVNNRLFSNNGSGIYFRTSSSNNIIADNSVNLNNYYGILLTTSSSYNTIAYNRVISNRWMGIAISTSCDNNIVVCNTVQDNGWDGICIGSNGNTIANNTASYNDWGISVYSSEGNTVTYNTVFMNNRKGILLDDAHGNDIQYNTVYSNPTGIYLTSSNSNFIANNSIYSNTAHGIDIILTSTGNTIINNTVSDNNYGITYYSSSTNLNYHNNFINNTIQAFDNTGLNQWDNGYPSGGNYWNDYTGVDIYSGPNQDISGSDGLGDTPYNNIGGGSGAQDNYPLMPPFPYIEFDMPLQQGWNLISLPLEQTNPYDIFQVLQSIDGKWDLIQTYDPTDDDHWIHYNVNWPSELNELDGLDHKIGFWINITEPGGTTLTVFGNYPTSTSITLYTGWNLVGYPSFVEKPISNSLTGTGYDAVEGFNASTPYHISPLSDSYMMKPGEGYWVHVPADTVWVVDW
jgi:parallel beta-helix repeat protein